MRVLTNNYSDCELLNLGYYGDGRGPYVVCQDGVAPRGSAEQDDRFLLRKDGVWVLNFAVSALPSKEQEENFVYEKVTEVLELLGQLTGRPVVEDKLPEGKTREQLLATLKSTQSRLWSRIQEAKGRKASM